MVQIALHTATADSVYEMMNQGLVDIGLFLETVNTEGLDYIRIMESDRWVVSMKPDDALVDKEYITKDVYGIPIRAYRNSYPTGGRAPHDKVWIKHTLHIICFIIKEDYLWEKD